MQPPPGHNPVTDPVVGTPATTAQAARPPTTEQEGDGSEPRNHKHSVFSTASRETLALCPQVTPVLCLSACISVHTPPWTQAAMGLVGGGGMDSTARLWAPGAHPLVTRPSGGHPTTVPGTHTLTPQHPSCPGPSPVQAPGDLGNGTHSHSCRHSSSSAVAPTYAAPASRAQPPPPREPALPSLTYGHPFLLISPNTGQATEPGNLHMVVPTDTTFMW